MKPEYVLPEPELHAFNCVRCHVLAKQDWFNLQGFSQPYGHVREGKVFPEFRVSRCNNCEAVTIWRGDDIVYPAFGAAEPPNPDMPAEVKADYEEAAAIASQSPRGAAALLRLAIQKICIALGQPGKILNDDIAALVIKGLPDRIQQALDAVRVIGNNAVHPGQIDLNDNRELANSLFKLVNLIADKMFTEPAHIKSIYDGLPKSQLDYIQRRDSP